MARLVPAIRERLPDLPEPAALGPNEEQFRIFDAVLQLLLRRATRRPMLLVVDDLHWADAGTLTMLRYVSRLLRESRICLVGNYRDVELDRRHPLTETLADLRRDAGYEHIALRGLEGTEVGEMLQSMAGHEVDGELVRSIRIETGGNPLFIREMLLHLKEEGALVEGGERWTSAAGPALAIPESVRQVIGRRLARLSEHAVSLLSAASAFNGPFRFDVALEAADLDERSGLDAVDAATRAQLIRASGAPDTYEFTHALIAHTLYSELNPSRRVRLHRRIAEALQARPVPSAAEVAYQFSQSVALPGADAGAAWAVRAADQAQTSYAWEQVVAFLEMTLELMAADEERRAEVTGRLGLALAATPRAAEAVAAMKFWADSLFQRGADEEGLDYLMDGYQRLGVADGLEIARFAGPHLLGLDNRPTVWFRMVLIRAEREAGPDYTEAWLTPEREELFRAWDALPGPAPRTLQRIGMRVFKSRAEVLALPRTYSSRVISMTFLAGEWRHCAPLHAVMAEATKREGRANESCEYRCFQAACLISLGEFAAAKAALALAAEGARSLPASAQAHMQIRSREKEFAWALDQGWHSISDDDDLRFGPADNPIKGWGASALYTAAARAKARLGFTERAMELLAYAMPEIERGIAGLGNYPRMICNAASALWEGNIATWADRIQCNLITKVIEPDFRYPMVDARLAAAQLCALQGRIDEASEWFAKARKVLEEQGARPLRAICDHDEALALVRHSRKTGTRLDRPRVRELLDKASTQFVDIGMTGWITRAADLTAEVG